MLTKSKGVPKSAGTDYTRPRSIEVYKVIGAMYGDEGKGYLTDNVVRGLRERNKITLNIKHNGTAQAEHTVLHMGKRHIFKTYGAGTFAGASTLLYKTFYVCPMSLCVEEKELVKEFGEEYSLDNGKMFIHEECAIILPWDKELNLNRDEKFNTCGYGLFEAIQREKIFKITLRDLYNLNESNMLEEYLRHVRDNYYASKCETFGEELIANWCEDVRHILKSVKFGSDVNTLISNFGFNALVFESGQGLGLSKEKEELLPNLTPSFTGSQNILSFYNDFTLAGGQYFRISLIRTYYVTRPYTTRHGNGELDRECNLDELPIKSFNETNVYNEHQGEFRYAPLAIHKLYKHVTQDYKLCEAKEKEILGVSEPEYILYVTNTHLIKELDGKERVFILSKDRLSSVQSLYNYFINTADKYEDLIDIRHRFKVMCNVVNLEYAYLNYTTLNVDEIKTQEE